MNSFTLFSLFYLINFLLKIRAQTINIDCNGDSSQYFNSIKHECQNCNGVKFNDICYASNRSVYGIPVPSFTDPCNEADDFMTELDEDGNHLGRFMCAKTKQNNPDPTTYGILQNSFSFNTFLDIRRPENGYSPNGFSLKEFDSEEINYSFRACLEGQYDKSCQYIANLCVLYMYKEESDDKNSFCKRIFDFERKKKM